MPGRASRCPWRLACIARGEQGTLPREGALARVRMPIDHRALSRPPASSGVGGERVSMPNANRTLARECGSTNADARARRA
jgi:hypothetical protein